MSKILCLHINLSDHVITKSIRAPGSSYYEIFKDIILNNTNISVSQIFCIRNIAKKVHWEIIKDLQKPFCRHRLRFVIIRTGGTTHYDYDLKNGCIICLQDNNKTEYNMLCGHVVHRDCFFDFTAVDNSLECIVPFCKFKMSKHICRICNNYVLGADETCRDNWCCRRVVHKKCRNNLVPKVCKFYNSEKQPNSLEALC